ncbi:MAG TPA: protein kinase [Xanthomonadaceae bacterium]|nr:protein kinase [Xanthomonadaceae bacterium]
MTEPETTAQGADEAADLAQARAANVLLAELLELAEGARATRLAQRCGEDEALRLRVERLLELAETEDSLLVPGAPIAQGFADALFDVEDSLEPGSCVGRYRIVRELGHGGMSVVYLAEQDVDGFSRRVAIKRMHASAENSGMLQRFARERRILALLGHPDIARIIDVGGDAHARPYIVMEFVDGLPIDRYCDSHQLGLRERLLLTLRVISAVAFAHGKLVVHRDIKPSNILVDQHGHPKLLDFGIAKLVDDDDLELTTTARAPQTPAYASPEQVRGEPVGTASDIYQLGLLLHLLLTGALPYPHKALDARTLARAILAGHLPSPSQCVGATEPERAEDVARNRSLPSVESLRRALSGDLDQVVMKALSTDPADRYPSAGHLADDVRNVLEGRPVTARRSNWLYALGKAMRRHPAASGLSFVLVALLVVFATVVTSIAIDLDRARNSAVAQGELSDRVLEHVISTLRELEPELSGFEGSLVLQTLDRASAAAPAHFGEGPLTQAHLHMTLGRGYELLWAIDKAQEQYLAAERQLDHLARPDRRRMEARVQNGFGRVARVSGRGSDAEAAFRRAVELSDGDRDLLALNASARANLASLISAQGDRETALAMYRRAGDDLSHVYGDAHPNSLSLRLNIALVLLQDESHTGSNDARRALDILSELTDASTEALGNEAPLTLTATLLRGRTLCYLGAHAEGEHLLIATLPPATRILGEESLQVLKARSELGLAQVRLGRSESGMRELLQAATRFTERWNARGIHSARHSFGLNLAIAHSILRHDEEAIDALVEHAVDRHLIERTPELAHLLDHFRLSARWPQEE